MLPGVFPQNLYSFNLPLFFNLLIKKYQLDTAENRDGAAQQGDALELMELETFL